MKEVIGITELLHIINAIKSVIKFILIIIRIGWVLLFEVSIEGRVSLHDITIGGGAYLYIFLKMGGVKYYICSGIVAYEHIHIFNFKLGGLLIHRGGA